jgi:hypothetical protein
MKFSIRDLLWLTAFVAVGIVWLMDRNAMRRERAELAKREAELTSRAKMWEAEANRAEKRIAFAGDRLQAIDFALNRHGIFQSDLIDANNRQKSGGRPQKLIFVDDPKMTGARRRPNEPLPTSASEQK